MIDNITLDILNLKGNEMTITFGDNVRILTSEETMTLGLAGKEGQVFGETTPSVTGIESIGEPTNDYALNVYFEETDEAYWFAPHLLEFKDHGEGTEMTVGNHRAVRRADGSWEEFEVDAEKK